MEQMDQPKIVDDGSVVSEKKASNSHVFDGVTRAGAWLDVGFVIALVYCLSYILEPRFRWWFADPWTPFDIVREWYIPHGVSAALVVAGVFAWLFARRLTVATIGLHNRDIGSQILAGVYSLPFAYAALFLNVLMVTGICRIWHTPVWADPSGYEQSNAIRAAPCLEATIFFIIASVVSEEVTTRGILLPRLRLALGRWWPAVLISSALFGATHLAISVPVATNAFLFSLVLSYLYIRRASLISTVVGHLLFNLAQLFILPKILIG